MTAGTWTPDGSVASAMQYETPRVIEWGNVVEVTNGTSRDDTADMRKYYF